MKRKLLILTSLCFFAAVSMMISPANAEAQTRSRYEYDDDRDYNRYNRYEDYRYTRRYSKSAVSSFIARVEQSSNRFRRDLERDLINTRVSFNEDETFYIGARREHRIARDVRNFENTLDLLREDFNENSNWWESRYMVKKAVDSARPVATRMRNNQFSYNVEAEWRVLLRDINRLAAAYRLPLVA